MTFKIVFSFVATLMLSGCVLQSSLPNFDQSQGELLLGKVGGTYTPFILDKDKWKRDGEDMKFVANGKHYVVKDKTKSDEALFIPVLNEWWLVQFHEVGKESGYVFANVQPDAIYIHPLACDNLIKSDTKVAFISFKGGDCFLMPDTKVSDAKALIPAAGQRVMKLVLKK